MKVRLLISYDGTEFEGWQRQPGDKPTIQSTIEMALSRIFNARIALCASGRTDGGVHAEGQVAHFRLPEGAPEPNGYRFLHSLNSMLPDSISVKKAWLAPEDFNAMRSATRKTYRYLIYNHKIRDPLKYRYATWYRQPLDPAALQALTDVLVGEHDFKSFQTSGTDVKSTVRVIESAKWSIVGENLLQFQIVGSGFLKQMVRNIVGTAIHLHINGGTPSDMQRILAAKDRREAKETAPSQGLTLHSVEYPAHLDNECREL